MSFVSGLVAHYRCDDAAGANLVDAVAGLTLTQTNTPGSAAGVIGNGRTFATNQYAGRASDANFAPGDVNFGISVWVKFTADAAAAEAIFANRTSGAARNWQLYRGASGFILFDIFSASGTKSVNSTVAVPGGVWTHIIAWHNASADTLNVRVGGVTYTATTSGATPYSVAALVAVGANNNGSDQFLSGTVDELSFFKAIPTALEQSRLAAGWAYPFTSPARVTVPGQSVRYNPTTQPAPVSIP